jgi:hypothetical protein
MAEKHNLALQLRLDDIITNGQRVVEDEVSMPWRSCKIS